MQACSLNWTFPLATFALSSLLCRSLICVLSTFHIFYLRTQFEARLRFDSNECRAQLNWNLTKRLEKTRFCFLLNKFIFALAVTKYKKFPSLILLEEKHFLMDFLCLFVWRMKKEISLSSRKIKKQSISKWNDSVEMFWSIRGESFVSSTKFVHNWNCLELSVINLHELLYLIYPIEHFIIQLKLADANREWSCWTIITVLCFPRLTVNDASSFQSLFTVESFSIENL